MAYINSIEISKFRGIKELSVSHFSNINLIVGDNNSGKTTFLEALQLLFVNPSIESIKRVFESWTAINPRNDFYTSFINMFNNEQNNKNLSLSLFANTNHGEYDFELKGKEEDVFTESIIDEIKVPRIKKIQLKKQPNFYPEMTKLFTGEIITKSENNVIEKEVRCTALDRIISSFDSKKEVQYLPSFGHMRSDLLQNIVNNLEYKKLTIDILRKFDESIEDICYTKTDNDIFLETIITKKGVNMPFSVYGDGIKKILYILNRIFDAKDSVLLIDEIETGLHKKYYDLLFPVVFYLAEKFNTQLFISTHSREVIESILKFGDYDNKQHDKDPIRVITLKKIKEGDSTNVICRNITGKYAYENKKAFDFEVRL